MSWYGIGRLRWLALREHSAVALLTIGLAIVLIVAACGGTGSASDNESLDAGTTPETPPVQQEPSALAFAACMRANGVANFPDPAGPGATGGGGFRIGSDVVQNPNFEPARAACQHLIPQGGGQAGLGGGGGNVDPALLLEFARCMRENGVPEFPDPSPDGGFVGGLPVDTSTPQFQSALQVCGQQTGLTIQTRPSQ